MQLEQKIAKILIQRKLTLATAESCSGGLLAHQLTNIPGASSFFLLGVIAYDNAAKTKILKIPATLLKKYGAVSAQTAKKMSQNVRSVLKTDLGVSITGIAGPTGGTTIKPVGLVYISASSAKTTVVKECRFKGSRLQIKNQAVRAALRIILQMRA